MPPQAQAQASLEPAAACYPAPVETCLNAHDDDCNGLVDEGCGLPAGELTFALSWLGQADFDLEIVDPGGELLQVGYPVSSGLEKLRDCPSEACGSTQYEYVYLPKARTLQPGTYRVRVVLRSGGLWGQGGSARLAVGTVEGTREYRARLLAEGEASGFEWTVAPAAP